MDPDSQRIGTGASAILPVVTKSGVTRQNNIPVYLRIVESGSLTDILFLYLSYLFLLQCYPSVHSCYVTHLIPSLFGVVLWCSTAFILFCFLGGGGAGI